MATQCCTEQAQGRVVRFLSASSTHHGAAVTCLATHGARIFLAGDLAFKLKRAVKYPFLDFSTLGKRRAALETELVLNRRTAPHLYLEVRGIHAAMDGSLSWNGDGPIVDWVLVMRRFDQEALLDSIAQRDGLGPALTDRLADVVAEMHRLAPAVKRSEGDYFAAMASDNMTMLAQSAIASKIIQDVQEALAASCTLLHDHLDRRAHNGFVRHCHGDLHLRNIVVIDELPVPFDALEFDAELATGDVYYDLAFLLMDIEHRGLRAMATRLLSRYAAITDDLEGLSALSLFLATRAAIRAKVAMLSTFDTQSGQSEVQSYLDLAAAYLRPATPGLVAIGGLSGTGKSSVAYRLSPEVRPQPGALIVRSDILRKQLHGVSETTRLPLEAYTGATTREVYAGLNAKAKRILATGHSAIIDAVFATPEERAAIERLARDCNVPFVGLWLDAPLAIRRERVSQRILDPSDANEAVAEKQETYALGDLAWHRISATGSLDDTVRSCIAALSASLPLR